MPLKLLVLSNEPFLLFIEIKRLVYRACVLSVLLYSFEYWTPLCGWVVKIKQFSS